MKIRVNDNCMLRTIRGKVGYIVRSTTFNANNLPGYIVEIDDPVKGSHLWTLYDYEVEVVESTESAVDS